MKIFQIFFVCATVFAGLANADKASSIKQFKNECKVENGIDVAADSEKLTVEDGNCYYACFYKKFGIMNEDGSFNIEEIKRKFSKSNPVDAVQKKLDETIEKYCKDKSGNNCNLATCLSKVPKDQWQIQ